MKTLPPDKAKRAYQILFGLLALYFIGRPTLHWVAGAIGWQLWLTQAAFAAISLVGLYAFVLFAISKVYPRRDESSREP